MKTCLNLAALLLLSVTTFAEIEKKATACSETGELCFYWWPALPEIEGWSQDEASSYRYRANTQAPEGFTFASAETVIYGNAVYKASQPESATLAQFIEHDKQAFLARDPDMKITLLSARTSASGLPFTVYSFPPSGQGNWELVGYSEEQDKEGNGYYLVFVLSSRTQAGMMASQPAFFEFIANY